MNDLTLSLLEAACGVSIFMCIEASEALVKCLCYEYWVFKSLWYGRGLVSINPLIIDLFWIFSSQMFNQI